MEEDSEIESTEHQKDRNELRNIKKELSDAKEQLEMTQIELTNKDTMNKELLDKQQREFDSKFCDLNQQHEETNDEMKMELQDLKEQKLKDQNEMERITKELTKAEDFLSLYESMICLKNSTEIQQQKQHQELTKMNQHYEEMNEKMEKLMKTIEVQQTDRVRNEKIKSIPNLNIFILFIFFILFSFFI